MLPLAVPHPVSFSYPSFFWSQLASNHPSQVRCVACHMPWLLSLHLNFVSRVVFEQHQVSWTRICVSLQMSISCAQHPHPVSNVWLLIVTNGMAFICPYGTCNCLYLYRQKKNKKVEQHAGILVSQLHCVQKLIEANLKVRYQPLFAGFTPKFSLATQCHQSGSMQRYNHLIKTKMYKVLFS